MYLFLSKSNIFIFRNLERVYIFCYPTSKLYQLTLVEYAVFFVSILHSLVITNAGKKS